MHVISDDPEVQRLVTLIAHTVRDQGGVINSELVVNHEGARLWLSFPRGENPYADAGLDKPHPDAPPLLVIPNDLHIPVTNLDWRPSRDHLAYRGDTSHLSDAQRTILDAMVALFNQVDKVSVIGQGYARHALGGEDESDLSGDPELLALIREARPGFARQQGAEVLRTQPDLAGDSPAHSVVRSRLRSEMGEGDEGPIGFFMPMIDMLNHHPYGSRYERTDNGDWLIRVHHPTASDQVFVRYNKADSLGVALGLGYFEPDARFVASVACEFELEPIGRIQVRGVGVNRRRLPVPRIDRVEGGLSVSGVVLEQGRRETLLTLLAMPLRSLSPDSSGSENADVARRLLSAIVAENVDFFTRMSELCATDSDPAEHSLRPLMGQVAARQLELLAEWG